MNLAWLVSMAAGALVGAIVGGGVAWQLCTRRSLARQRRIVVAAKAQYVAGTQGLRATTTRLQAALDQEKLAIQGRLAAAAADHRAALGRVEGQLRFAYAEIDRLQTAARPPAAGATGDGHGFALTRPFER